MSDNWRSTCEVFIHHSFSVSRSCPYNGDFKCNDGRCLRSSAVCDGYDHCESGEDEEDCGKLIILCVAMIDIQTHGTIYVTTKSDLHNMDLYSLGIYI